MNVKPLVKYLKYLLISLLLIYLPLRFWLLVSGDVHEMPGRLESIGELNIHVQCQGSGSPVILLETGFGSDSLDTWGYVATQLAKSHKTCFYDRPGSGWSDSVPDDFGTAGKARLLSQLASRLADGEPLVLVAHSYGGILARQAISQYAAPVSGLILVDSAHEDQHNRLKPWFNPVSVSAAYGTLADAISGYSEIKALVSGQPFGRVSAWHSSIDFSKVLKSYTAEGGFFTPLQSYDYQLQQLPMLLLEHDPEAYPDTERWNNGNVIWEQLQKELAQLSEKSTLKRISGASHNIPGDQPDALVKEVLQFVQQGSFAG